MSFVLIFPQLHGQNRFIRNGQILKNSGLRLSNSGFGYKLMRESINGVEIECH